MHDARSDARALKTAGEIRANKMRHGAAVAHLRKEHSVLSTMLEGRPPKDESEMREYAKRRKSPSGMRD
jgi:hypothetical protein